MNIDILTNNTPKPWLNISCNDILCKNIDVDTIEMFDGSSFSNGFLKLHETLINPIPDNNNDVIISAPASNDGHILVSSQALGAQTVAYISDLPPSGIENKIESDDTLTYAECKDTEFNINVNNINRLQMTNDTNLSSQGFNGGAGTALLLNDSSAQLATFNGILGSINIFNDKVNLTSPGFSQQLNLFPDKITLFSSGSDKVIVNSLGVKLESYQMPINSGSAGQILTTNGINATWETLIKYWINAYYDPVLGSVFNVPLGAINNFVTINTPITLYQNIPNVFDSPSNGVIRYIGATQQTFNVSYSLSVGSDANNVNLVSRLFINNVVTVPGSTSFVFCPNTAIACTSSTSILTIILNQFDTISLKLCNNTSAGSIGQVQAMDISLSTI